MIRVQDKIRIINPQIFVRCGYPLSKKIVKETIITAEQKEAIHTLLDKFNIRRPLDSTLFLRHDKQDNKKWGSYDKILDVLASAVLFQNCFGGKQRQVFSEEVPELKDVHARVLGRRVVKTGKYYAPYSGYDSWTGEYDYEPGGLSDMKTHVILECCFCDYGLTYNGKCEFEIEKCHVEKVSRSVEDGELLLEI